MFFIDYGNKYDCPARDIRLIHEEFLTQPRLAMKFQLADIESTLKERWSEEAIQFMAATVIF